MTSNLSFFDEKRGVVAATFEKFDWWQTVQELHIKVKLTPDIKSKQIQLKVEPNSIKLVIAGNLIFEGKLYRTVVADETIWTIEDGFLCIVLVNAKHSVSEEMWESLFADGSYAPDTITLIEMRKNLDLEKFQIENPGFDFSGAKLSKPYDKLPGWSKDRLKELKEKSQENGSGNEQSIHSSVTGS